MIPSEQSFHEHRSSRFIHRRQGALSRRGSYPA